MQQPKHDTLESNLLLTIQKAAAHLRRSRKRAVLPDVLEQRQVDAVLHELEGVEPARTVFLLGATTGIRRSEVTYLRWADVDFEHSALYIPSFDDGSVQRPKWRDAPRRAVPLQADLLAALATWKEQSPGQGPDDWVFGSDQISRRHLWLSSIWRKLIVPASVRTGIAQQPLGWHSLRKFYAAQMQASGMSLRTCSQRLGHTSVLVTERLYGGPPAAC